jgi:hypothetical protein
MLGRRSNDHFVAAGGFLCAVNNKAPLDYQAGLFLEFLGV